MDWFVNLVTNPFLLTALSSWAIAQILKALINLVITKKFDIERLFGDGGMPSGHSATVSSLATITAFLRGFDSFEFALAAILAIIVCHDAMGVRLETGKQAVVINQIMATIEKLSTTKLKTSSLKEFVGHTPLQVAAGILIGIANGCFLYFVFF